MKIIRSTKCTTKYMTKEKINKLRLVLSEYGNVVNQFIDVFWCGQTPTKEQLLKPIVDIPNTWLTARLRKVAAREAIDMINASKERDGDKAVKPRHKGKRMYVSCTIATLCNPDAATEYDLWLELRSIGNKVAIDIPIRLHRHYNRLNNKGKRLNSYIITPNYVQFVFEVETGQKKQGDNAVGVDTGINALASLSTGKQLGLDIKQLIERIKRCKQGSKGQQQARRALKQRIDEVAKELVSREDIDLIVAENLSKLGHKSKVKRRLTKNIRRSIGLWNWRYWLRRLQFACEENRVSFRQVAPYYTSQTCPKCGHVDRSNRCGEKFKCLNCGHEDNADINAALNILNRFLMGKYGSHYKPLSYNFL